MADSLSMVSTTLEGWTILAVTGEIDVSTVGELRGAMDEVTSDGSARLVFDLTGVSFIDSSGLSVLVGASKALAAGCVRVAGTKRVRDLLRITVHGHPGLRHRRRGRVDG